MSLAPTTIANAGDCDSDRRAALDQAGYVVFERLMNAELLAALRTRVTDLYAEEGDRAGRNSSKSAARRGWPTWSPRERCFIR